MSQPFDINQFPDLPFEVVKAFEAQGAALESSRFKASVERAARLHEQAAVSPLVQAGSNRWQAAESGILLEPRSQKADRSQTQGRLAYRG